MRTKKPTRWVGYKYSLFFLGFFGQDIESIVKLIAHSFEIIKHLWNDINETADIVSIYILIEKRTEFGPDDFKIVLNRFNASGNILLYQFYIPSVFS